MKANSKNRSSASEALLKEVLERQKAEQQKTLKNLRVGSEKLQPSALYQDDGGAYNANLSFIQK